jgi:hypothetical protein
MMRTWNLLGLSALVAVTLVSRAPAGGEVGEPKTVEQQLKSLDRTVKGLVDTLNLELKKISEAINGHQKRLNTLEANDADTTLKLGDARLRVERLEKQVEKLRLDLETLQKRTSGIAFYPPTDKADLDEIRAQLRKIEQMLDRTQGGTERKAFASPAGRTGRIVLVNQHPEELLFLINNRRYRVSPGQTATIRDVPAGTFTYEVLSPTTGSAVGIRNRTLDPGETFTITARP